MDFAVNIERFLDLFEIRYNLAMMRLSLLMMTVFFAIADVALAAMTSTNYQIRWDAIDSGGREIGTSTSYSLRDSIDGVAIGAGTSTLYQLSSGYRAGDISEVVLALTIGSQSASSLTVYSAFQATGTQVSVSSTANYVVGDVIAVIENQGLSQQVAVGKITSIVGSVINIDAWAGDQAGMATNPLGGNDFVANLSAATISFGSLSPGSATTSVAFSSVLTDIATGYSVYVQASRILQNASAHIITPVSDGVVTTGSEEYGASVTGATAFGPGSDTAVTTTQRIIQSSASASGSTPDRVAMTYKVAITGTTSPGEYSQDIFYTVTANF